MSFVKLIIVAGNGGARADFIAGWLGLLPTFINNYWNIDLETGCSIGNMGNLREIDNNSLPNIAVQNQQLTLLPTADTTWAVACHGNNLKIEHYHEYISNGSIKFLSINTAGANQKQILWDFFVKTYLSNRRGLEWARDNKHWVIDDSIDKCCTDAKRIAAIKNLLTNSPTGIGSTSLPNIFPATTIDYVQLFQSGGSYYLCDQLNIVTTDNHHKLWDFMLQLADAPDNINVWGINWQKQDYFPD